MEILCSAAWSRVFAIRAQKFYFVMLWPKPAVLRTLASRLEAVCSGTWPVLFYFS